MINKYFYRVKKTVKTHNDLLISLASKGDPVAFHALISPLLEKNYIEMRINGKSHSDSCEILFSDALTLFNFFKKSSAPDNFDEWVNEQNLINVPDQDKEDRKLSADQKSAVRQFSQELQRYLIRMTSNSKFSRFSNTVTLFSNPWFKYGSIAASVLLALLSLYLVLLFSNSAIILIFKTSEKEYTITYPFNENVTKTIDTTKIDTNKTTENSDSSSEESADSLSDTVDQNDENLTKSVPEKKNIAKPNPVSYNPKPAKPVYTPKPEPQQITPKPKPVPIPAPEPVEQPVTEPTVSQAAPAPVTQSITVNETEPDESSSPQQSTSQSTYSEPESEPYTD